jgi:NADH dehydrogenase
MAVLSPSEIASPIRGIFRHNKNVKVLMGDAVGFDLERQVVKFKDTEVTLRYDYLIVAAGAGHAYFGHDEWAPLAPGLKTIEDALEIRRRVLMAFENAERRAAAGAQIPPLNFLIVGGGPTGVELAGALADIARRVMAHDFRYIDPKQARVILLEGGPIVLPAYPPDLSESAEKQLKELGVEVRTNTVVTAVEEGHVRIGDEVLPSAVTMWAAGVAASGLGKQLGAKTDKAGRVLVANDLTIPDHRNVFVVGDLASYADAEGRPVPGVAPAAIQMGKFVAEMIKADLNREPRKTFHYFDKGSLATIGRSKAVGMVGGVHFSGFIAWLAWLFVHLLFLIGFRNRFFVMTEWAITYFSYQRAARLITDK